MAERQYKLRAFRNEGKDSDGEYNNFNVTMPTGIARKLNDTFGEGNFRFEVELTTEGVLYRVVAPNQSIEDLEELPFGMSESASKAPTPKAAPAKAKPAPKAASKPAPKAAPKAKPAAKPAGRPAAKAKPQARVRVKTAA